MPKRIVFLLLGGSLTDPEFLKNMWRIHRPQAVICANGGARHARDAGLKPTLIVGDMDSLPEEVRAHFRQEGIPEQVFPRVKDETDAVIACKQALALHPDEIWDFGAFGGRVDHMLANLSLLLMGEKNGVFVKLLDEAGEVFLVTREKFIEGKAGDTVSILALFEDAIGVTLEGFAYPLTKGEMKRDFPLGMSNRLGGERARIEVETGSLLVIKYFHSCGG